MVAVLTIWTCWAERSRTRGDVADRTDGLSKPRLDAVARAASPTTSTCFLGGLVEQVTGVGLVLATRFEIGA
jgi:hypothetical protein